MIRPQALQNIFNISLVSTEDRQDKTTPPCCPQCGYNLDRPHAFTCSRCGGAVPGAQGCNGCGKCRKR